MARKSLPATKRANLRNGKIFRPFAIVHCVRHRPRTNPNSTVAVSKTQNHPIRSALTSAARPATVVRMDTMKLLLGATVALLLGALAVSWQGMTSGVKNTSQNEIARLKKQVAELRQEQDNLQREKQLQQLRSMPVLAPGPSAAEIADVKAQLEANNAALAQLEQDKQKAARDAKIAQDEEGLLSQIDLEKGDTELKRARMIGQALLIGRVVEYVEDGSFITFEVLMPEQVQVGTILGIRRKTGILGQLTVSDITADGGIANPLPGFGPVLPKPGDELILPPQY